MAKGCGEWGAITLEEGSLLGPILLVNALGMKTGTMLRKFADGMELGTNKEEGQNVIQEELNYLENWSDRNRMRLTVQN